MRIPRFAFVAALAAALAFVAPRAAAQAGAATNKVVLQVSDNDAAKWNLALNNARNVQTDLGEKNVDIEIVAYGPGINMLKLDSPVANRVSEALGKGIKVVACENTMTNTKTTKGDMYPGISYVMAGVTHIMKRQREGWAYIRP